MKAVFCEIDGKKYPLVYSAGAISRMTSLFGGYENIQKYMTNIDGMIEHICEVAAALIDQGCKYMNLTGEEKPENAAVDEDGRWVPLTVQEIEVFATDVGELAEAIGEAFAQPSTVQVKTKESKNA